MLWFTIGGVTTQPNPQTEAHSVSGPSTEATDPIDTGTPESDGVGGYVHELAALDSAIYAAVAATPTPKLDAALRGLTEFADNSKLWFATAGVLSIVGGAAGRRAALNGVAAIGLASLVTNQGFKRAHRRPRPDPEIAAVPQTRRVPMPTSTSFPSGHSPHQHHLRRGVGRALSVSLGIPRCGWPPRPVPACARCMPGCAARETSLPVPSSGWPAARSRRWPLARSGPCVVGADQSADSDGVDGVPPPRSD